LYSRREAKSRGVESHPWDGSGGVSVGRGEELDNDSGRRRKEPIILAPFKETFLPK
jgi:hypothetical protein